MLQDTVELVSPVLFNTYNYWKRSLGCFDCSIQTILSSVSFPSRLQRGSGKLDYSLETVIRANTLKFNFDKMAVLLVESAHDLEDGILPVLHGCTLTLKVHIFLI